MKKLISILLCFIITLGTVLPVFASSVEQTENKTPYILVAGMDVLPLYNEDASQKIWPMGTGTILSLVSKLFFPISKLLITKNYDEFGDALFPVLNDAFAGMKCDADGNSVNTVKVEKFMESMAHYPKLYPKEMKDEIGIVNAACKKFGAENVYFFNYDWRLDPLTHADDLHELIEKAKQDTGSDKVMLGCCSMGGTITMAYIQKYGSDSLKSVSLLSTAFCGVEAVGDILSGELYIDKTALIRRVICLGKTTPKKAIFTSLMKTADALGLVDRITDFANELLTALNSRIYDEFLTETFGTMPGIWALIDRADYEKASAFMLDEVKNEKLIERTQYYLNNVQANAEALLKSAQENSTNVYIVCQYNMQNLSITKRFNTNNDLLIDVKYASGGAVAADLASRLPDDYVQAVNDGHNHISKDRVIDASTCMLPENTWFIKDQAHVDYNVGETTDFLFEIASSDEQLSVFDNEKYPQFMQYNADKNTLFPLK